jgi:hypothetical protein
VTRDSRVFVTGNPRSGTTWAARVLGHCAGAHLVHEPDDDERAPFAPFATRGLGHLPDLRPGDAAPRYELMWEMAFEGGWPQRPWSSSAAHAAALLPPAVTRAPLLGLRRATHRRHGHRHHVVKSVRTLFSAEWVADRCQPRVLVILRSPLNMLGSWLRLGWGSYGIDDHPRAQAWLEPLGLWPAPPEPGVANTIWTICARNHMLRQTAARNPQWQVAWHEDLSADPIPRFGSLSGALGLRWTEEASEYVRSVDRPGSGWDVVRVASEEVEVWRKRLDPEQLQVAQVMIDRFESATGLSATGGGSQDLSANPGVATAG